MTTSIRTGLGLLVALLVLAVSSNQLIAQDAPKAADAAQEPPPPMKKAEGGFANGDVVISNPGEAIQISDEEIQRLDLFEKTGMASNIVSIGGWNVWWVLMLWLVGVNVVVYHLRQISKSLRILVDSQQKEQG